MAARAEPGDLKLSRPGFACSGDAVTQTQRRPLPHAFAGAAKRDSDVLCTTSEMSEASEGDPSGAPRLAGGCTEPTSPGSTSTGRLTPARTFSERDAPAPT